MLFISLKKNKIIQKYIKTYLERRSYWDCNPLLYQMAPLTPINLCSLVFELKAMLGTHAMVSPNRNYYYVLMKTNEHWYPVLYYY